MWKANHYTGTQNITISSEAAHTDCKKNHDMERASELMSPACRNISFRILLALLGQSRRETSSARRNLSPYYYKIQRSNPMVS